MSVPRIAVLVVVVGAALVANPLWLFPHDEEPVYTYERAEIQVTGNGLDYSQPRVDGRTARANALEGIDCQYRQRASRACAFDKHLLADGPVTVAIDDPGFSGGDPAPDYTEIDGRYYERTENATEVGGDPGIRYDVHAVAPEAMLADVATDLRDIDPKTVEGLGLDERVAVRGESVTTRERLPDSELGAVYRLDDGYYTVVLASVIRPDRALVEPGTRAVMSAVGVACLLVALGVATSRRRDPGE